MAGDLMRFGAIAGPANHEPWEPMTPPRLDELTQAVRAGSASVSDPNLRAALDGTLRLTQESPMTEPPVTDYSPRRPIIQPAPDRDARPATDHHWRTAWDNGTPWWVTTAEAEAVEQGREAVRDQANTVAYWPSKPFNPPSDDPYAGAIFQGSWEAVAADGFIDQAREQGYR